MAVLIARYEHSADSRVRIFGNIDKELMKKVFLPHNPHTFSPLEENRGIGFVSYLADSEKKAKELVLKLNAELKKFPIPGLGDHPPEEYEIKYKGNVQIPRGSWASIKTSEDLGRLITTTLEQEAEREARGFEEVDVLSVSSWLKKSR